MECFEPGLWLHLTWTDILSLGLSSTIFWEKNCSAVSKVLNTQLKLVGMNYSQRGSITTLKTCDLKEKELGKAD